jgi:hypothetical protein
VLAKDRRSYLILPSRRRRRKRSFRRRIQTDIVENIVVVKEELKAMETEKKAKKAAQNFGVVYGGSSRAAKVRR